VLFGDEEIDGRGPRFPGTHAPHSPIPSQMSLLATRACQMPGTRDLELVQLSPKTTISIPPHAIRIVGLIEPAVGRASAGHIPLSGGGPHIPDVMENQDGVCSPSVAAGANVRRTPTLDLTFRSPSSVISSITAPSLIRGRGHDGEIVWYQKCAELRRVVIAELERQARLLRIRRAARYGDSIAIARHS